MKHFLAVLLIAFSCEIFAQNAPPPPPPPPHCDTCKPTEPTLMFAEEMPRFPGGEAAFHNFLINNVHYPDTAKKYGREGTVYVYFEVNKDGSISNIRCQKGVPNAPDLCDEALRVFALMPNWEPGKMNGKNVKVSMTVPVRFTLH